MVGVKRTAQKTEEKMTLLLKPRMVRVKFLSPAKNETVWVQLGKQAVRRKRNELKRP
jgi:hypothetical protein